LHKDTVYMQLLNLG